MAHKRRKLIRVRVSEEEFRTLSEACKHSGTGSIGDLALQTMRQIVETSNPTVLDHSNMHLWVKELVSRLNSLQAEIERLETLLNVSPAKR